MKRLIPLLLLLLGVGWSALAQESTLAERTISGTIIDETGEALIGASVLVEGTSNGTVTDLDGNYELNVTVPEPVLVVSYTGYGTQRIVMGDEAVYNIALSEGVDMDEVVVTAIGTSRKKDDDLSSATLVNTEDIQRSGETGVLQGLSGKTSGVRITRNSGDPGAGAYIQIRGQNTILGDASPLIILDGVPISNSSTTAGGSGAGATAGVVQQSRLNDINPDDIESVTVLKGASAAAVYGTGAANGVLVITTKSGANTDRKRFSVSINTSVSVDEINREHAKQDIFGQGFPVSFYGSEEEPLSAEQWGQFGVPIVNTSLSYGDRIATRAGGPDPVDTDGESFIGDQTGTVYYPYQDAAIGEFGEFPNRTSQETFNDVNRDQVFQRGLTADLSASISFNTDYSNTFISFSRTDQEGIIRGNSDYERNTVRLNNRVDLLDNLDLRVNTSWTGTFSNRIQGGSNLNGLYLGYLRTSPDFNNTDYSGTYVNADGVPSPGQRGYRRRLGDAAPVYNNPGWTINRQVNDTDVDRFIIAPEVNWGITDGLTATVRYGLDFYTDERNTFFPTNSAGDYANGAFFRDDIKEQTQNFFAFVTGNYDLTSTIGLNFNVGYNIFQNTYDRQSGSSNNFFINDPSKFVFDNAVSSDQDASQFLSENRKNGVFGVVNLDYDDMLFLELTGRAERTTTIPDEVFFYPSVSLGWKVYDDPAGDVSFMKLRGSYGQIGIEPPLYVNRNIFLSSQVGQGWGDYLDGNNYGGAFRRGITQGNPDLTVETVSEWELGGDFRFLSNRLSIGATYYNRITEDALLPIEVPNSTGFSEVYANAAEITNEGVEIDAAYRLYSSEDFSARAFANFTHNRNIVTELPNVSRFILNGFTSTSSAVVEDEPFASIFGGRFARDEEGVLILNENGFPTVAQEQGVIGDPNPDWRGGLGAELNYKGVGFSFLFETSQGNDLWGGTAGVLTYFGIAEETAQITTADQDLVNYSGQTIPAGAEFRGYVEDFGAGPVAIDADYWLDIGGGFGPVGEQFVYDGSWTRLREITLSYSLPSAFANSFGMDNVTFGLTGRNLILWTEFEGVDPELNLTGASKGRGLDYFTNPGTRSYIANLNFGF